MKRIGNLYEKIIDVDNLILADKIAQRGKKKQYGVIRHDKNKDENILKLHECLLNNNFKTSKYSTFKVFEPKEREVFRLPYYSDRIVHHGIMNILEPIFVSVFTADSYSCIKGKGIHAAANNVSKALKDEDNTTYCLKLDITKFYPSIDHDILKQLLRRKFKDQQLLNLLDEIIESTNGIPIGSYLSQYFANFYLTYFDHWIKEVKGVNYYFRYADDIVIFSKSKEYLHKLLVEIRQYLNDNLKLTVKNNYQVFPVKIRGIDFLGYRFYPRYTLLRKSIKKRFARMLARNRNKQSIGSYYGWCVHCNSRNLLKKLLNEEEIQRFRNKNYNSTFYRRKNKNVKNIKQRSNNLCLSNKK